MTVLSAWQALAPPLGGCAGRLLALLESRGSALSRIPNVHVNCLSHGAIKVNSSLRNLVSH